MGDIFSPEYWLFWAAALAIALYFPVRNLIFVLYVRRAQRGGHATDEAERQRLRRRAGATAALLSLIFALLYMNYLFNVRS